MAWNEYYDALNNELNQLLGQTVWQDGRWVYSTNHNQVYFKDAGYANPDSDRITELRGLLNTAYDPSQESTREQKLNSLVSQYETANQSAEAANEARYQQLLSGYTDRNANLLGNSQPYSFGSVANQFTTLGANNQASQAGVNSGYESRATGLGNESTAAYGGLRSQFDTDQAAVNSGYGTRSSTYGGAAESGYGNLRSGLNSALNANNAGWNDRSTAMNNAAQAGYSGLRSQFDTDQAAMNAAYSGRESQIGNLFAGLGDQARADVGNLYAQQRSSAAQQLASRGLGNSTVASSIDQGVTRNQAADINRLNETLRTNEIAMRSQLSGDTLAAQQAGLQNRSQLGMSALGQQLGIQQQTGADALQASQANAGNAANFGASSLGQQLGLQSQLSGDALAAQQSGAQNRSQLGMSALGQQLGIQQQTGADALQALQANAGNAANFGASSLGQQLGLQSQLSGDALAAQQSGAQNRSQLGMSSYGADFGLRSQLGSDALAAQQLGVNNANALGLQAANFGSQYATAAMDLTKEPLGVIERRTDQAPSLADIANLTLQLGRGNATVNTLPGFSSLGGYGTDWSKLFSGLNT